MKQTRFDVGEVAMTLEQYQRDRSVTQPAHAATKPPIKIIVFPADPDPGRDASWMIHGACRGMDPDLFFPNKGDNSAVAIARKVCQGCPVRVECREYGMSEKWGLWGGTSENDRKALRRGRRRSPGRKFCQICGEPFMSASKRAMYCGSTCKNRASKAGRIERIRSA